MSGIFGIFNRNGKAVEKKNVDSMRTAMSYWNPDEENVWVDGSVALGHGMLWNTPESKYEHLPLEKDAFVLTMDARIDNRDELEKEIELPDRPLSEIGDSEFILGAYKKWGEECPKHLLGDFSFAIWDEKKQQLFCAKDHVGVKQLYYHVSDDLFLFGNDLKVLTQYPNISHEINDEAVANYIVNHQLLSNTLTFFETFKKLPPAHTLTISNSKVAENCYWRLEDTPKIKLPNAEAYAKKLRELLEESVYARMRSDYPITSHLSGGLDSSSIAVLAARKLKEKGEKLLAFNWLHEPTKEDDPTHAEWANSKKIAKTEGINHNYVSLTTEDIYRYMRKRDIRYGETTTFWYEYPIHEASKKKDSRTILTGWGGDELATYHGQSYYSNLILNGKLFKLFYELNRKISTKTRSLKSILSMLYYDFLPIIPRKMYCMMPKVKCLKKSFPIVHHTFLSEEVEKQMQNKSALSMQPQSKIKNHMLAYWNHGHIQARIESWGAVSTYSDIEYAYPLLDKRILEVIIGTPADFFVHNGIGRYLFHSAVKGLFESDLNIKKIPEPNRVEKLANMTLLASKEFVKDNRRIKRSKYIDEDKLINLLEHMELKEIDKNFLNTLEDIETGIALYFL